MCLPGLVVAVHQVALLWRKIWRNPSHLHFFTFAPSSPHAALLLVPLNAVQLSDDEGVGEQARGCVTTILMLKVGISCVFVWALTANNNPHIVVSAETYYCCVHRFWSRTIGLRTLWRPRRTSVRILPYPWPLLLMQNVVPVREIVAQSLQPHCPMDKHNTTMDNPVLRVACVLSDNIILPGIH